MKQVIAVALGLLASSSIYAAPSAITSPIEMDDCPLLAENVRVSLSNGVMGSFNCASFIQVSTCSTAGRTTERTGLVPCDNDDTTDTPACNADGTMPTATVDGAYIYVATSNGGTVSPAPGDGFTCDRDDLDGAIPDPS